MKGKLYSFSLYLSFLALLGWNVVACSPASQSISQDSATRADSRSIDHAMGTTTIEGTPERVVVLTNEATDIVLALGLQPVGAVKSWLGDPYFEYIAADMAEATVVGDEFQPNLERIVALQPDLIIGSKVRQEAVYERLNAIAPTVFSETIGVTWKDNLILYAKALNREEAGQQLLQSWQQRVAEFKAKLSEQEIPEVSLVRFSPGMTRIYYKDSFPGQILEEVGLKRPASQDKDEFATEVGLESLSEVDSDILFYFTYDEGDQKGKAVEGQWLNHPLWKSLKVVQNNKVYAVNDVYWTTSGGIQSANKVLDDLTQYILSE